MSLISLLLYYEMKIYVLKVLAIRKDINYINEVMLNV